LYKDRESPEKKKGKGPGIVPDQGRFNLWSEWPKAFGARSEIEGNFLGRRERVGNSGRGVSLHCNRESRGRKKAFYDVCAAGVGGPRRKRDWRMSVFNWRVEGGGKALPGLGGGGGKILGQVEGGQKNVVVPMTKRSSPVAGNKKRTGKKGDSSFPLKRRGSVQNMERGHRPSHY